MASKFSTRKNRHDFQPLKNGHSRKAMAAQAARADRKDAAKFAPTLSLENLR